MRTILFILCFAFATFGAGEAQVKSEIDTDACAHLYVTAMSYGAVGYYQQAYDTGKVYIESCANLSRAYEKFQDITAYNTSRTAGLGRFAEYREWLKSVLYLNPDSTYYCSDAAAMLATFRWFNDERGNDFRGSLTLAYYIIDSTPCSSFGEYLKTKLKGTWDELYTRWSDSIPDPDKGTFDSTLPTLDDLGLGILRGNPADVKRFNDAVMGPVVSNVYSMPNPFTSETTISFTCRESAALKFEVFDVLGKKVYSGTNRVFDKGKNQIILPAAGIPSGLLYGRFQLPDGSAKTIILRKLE